MKRIINIALLSALSLCFSGRAQAQSVDEPVAEYGYPGVAFNNLSTDTVRINELLSEGEAASLQSPGARVAFFGKKFLGTPYVAHTLEGDEELLRINLDGLDCMTFVETAAALAQTLGEGRTSWRDFVQNLEGLRYRNGEMNGYASRKHYVCDWIVDNVYRGNVTDAVKLFPREAYMVKTIDFMSRHADLYAQLSDSATLGAIKAIENGYVNHRFPYLKGSWLGAKEVKRCFRDGDLVAFMCSTPGLDVSHWGMIIMDEKGEPHVLHASMSGGKVVLSDVSLYDFVKRNNFPGIRVVRLR